MPRRTWTSCSPRWQPARSWSSTSAATSGRSPWRGRGPPDFPDHDHLASYCGIAPKNRRSGTSVSSVRASRQGNKRLKNLLIFSCNSLVRSNNRFGEYCRSCRGRGMCHGEALKAVARKRLKVIYAIMRDKVPYTA